MALEIEQLIKLIIGAAVVVAVVGWAYLIFKNNIFSFFSNTHVDNISSSAKVFMSLIF